MRKDVSRRPVIALLAVSFVFCAVRSASCVELRGRVVDSKTGEPVADGEMGELVVTALSDPWAPLVRFRTADLVMYKKSIN